MSKAQIKEISNLLLEYSAGNYEYQGQISDRVDELDMIISGINMLGEELQHTNVSRDYFSSIFNAVTDYVMVVANDGQLIDVNKSAQRALGLDPNQLHNIKIDQLLLNDDNFFSSVKKKLVIDGDVLSLEQDLEGVDGNIINGQFTCSLIIDRFDKFLGYLVSIKDITEQKATEQKILKAIFTTQQKEQKRVADDLHDSLGQELSMSKMMISNLKRLLDDDKALDLVKHTTEILDSSVKHLREICYNLMPSVLSRGGLNMALADLVTKLEGQDRIKVDFHKNPQIDRLDNDLEIVIYRIAQEFINNMIKHSTADKLIIRLDYYPDENEVGLFLKENGQGFDIEQLHHIGENRGYSNLKTKVKAFNGILELDSKKGEGTMTFVKFPILPYHEED